MDLSNLKPAKGSVKKEKRIGRGQGSGKGGTSTKGHKGGQSRAGYSRKIGFEGGQMPLQRRVPKFGFTNLSRKEFKAINISTLQTLADARKLSAIDIKTLADAGLISKNDMVKVLGNGKLTLKLDVTAHAFSKSAKAAIEALKGTATII
ncbi:MAG: 50S ribosomal protein L15 [Bacteroidales bacterium]|nr:50S ribosomal protein L15 [Bacteroidales bacterium]